MLGLVTRPSMNILYTVILVMNVFNIQDSCLPTHEGGASLGEIRNAPPTFVVIVGAGVT